LIRSLFETQIHKKNVDLDTPRMRYQGKVAMLGTYIKDLRYGNMVTPAMIHAGDWNTH